MKNNIENIEIYLENLFLENLNINFKENSELKKTHFFSYKLNIPIRELLIIFDLIQTKFNINIPEDYVVSGNFSTFENIYSIVEQCILKNINKASSPIVTNN